MTNCVFPALAAGPSDMFPLAGRRGGRCSADEHDNAALGAFDSAGLGALLIGEDGYVIAANAVACELLDRSGRQRLVGRRVAFEAHGPVRADNLYAAHTGPGSRSRILLERNGGSAPLFAHVVGLGGIGDDTTRGGRRLALLIDPASYAALRFEAFVRAYRLTSAEARLLVEILTGRGVGAARRALQITEPTARTHLKHIFAKTETKRQTELLSLFFGAMRQSPSGQGDDGRA